MESKNNKHDWLSYWANNKLNLETPLGKHVAKDLITALIRTFPSHNLDQVKILEIGCGEGHILGWIIQKFGNAINRNNILGVEKDIDVIKVGQSFYPDLNFYAKDITTQKWADELGDYHMVMFINSLHEVFSSCYDPEAEEIDTKIGKKLIESTIEEAASVLPSGGYLLIYDGVEYEGNLDEKIIFTLKNKTAEMCLEKFLREYKAYKIEVIEGQDNGRVLLSMSKRDFSRFVTKLELLWTSIWSIEKNESYQYFSEIEFQNAIRKNGLSVVYKASFTSHIEHWNSIIEIENGEFPFEHFAIVEKKL